MKNYDGIIAQRPQWSRRERLAVTATLSFGFLIIVLEGMGALSWFWWKTAMVAFVIVAVALALRDATLPPDQRV